MRGVPTRELLSQRFADERACQLFDPARAATRPIPFGDPDGRYSTTTCLTPAGAAQAASEEHGTTNLTVTDRWGNVAEYTLTIEQTGGSGITVPGYGFLLNNELTDFNFTPAQRRACRTRTCPGPGKRPRSSMSPTIVLTTAGRCSPWARPAGRRSSPRSPRCCSATSTGTCRWWTRSPHRGSPPATARAARRNRAIVNGPLGAGLIALGHTLASDSGDRRGHGHPPAARRTVRGRRRDHSPGRRLRDGGPPGLTDLFP